MKKTHSLNEELDRVKNLAGITEDKSSQLELNRAIFDVITAAEQVDKTQVAMHVVKQDQHNDPMEMDQLIEKLNFIVGFLRALK